MPSFRSTSETAAPSDYERWSANGIPFEIEYPVSLMLSLQDEVMDSFYKTKHGGIEVGGLLFGNWLPKTNPPVLRLEAGRAIECEHASGPAFLLSQKDVAKVQEQIASFETDEELQGLQVAGWYHSHHRSDLRLNEEDIAVQERLFREPWQVALLLKPSQSSDLKGAFYCRGAGGKFPADADPQEFELPAARYRQPDPLNPHRPIAPRAGGGLHGSAASSLVDDALKPDGNSEPADAEAGNGIVGRAPATRIPFPFSPTPADPSQEESQPVRQRSRVWVWTLMALLIGAAGGLWLPNPMRPVTLEEAPLKLRLLDTRGQLRAEWEARDSRLLDSPGGTLEFSDGEQKKEIQLSAEDLRSGSTTYERQGQNVSARLHVTRGNGEVAQAVAHFLGKRSAQEELAQERQVQNRQTVDQRQSAADRQELAQTTRELEQAEAANARLERRIADLERYLAIARRTIRTQPR